MPVDAPARTHQPFGLLHDSGASAALAALLGSFVRIYLLTAEADGVIMVRLELNRFTIARLSPEGKLRSVAAPRCMLN